MTYALVLVFFVEGQPQFATGALPRFFDTYEECQERRDQAIEYLRKVSSLPYKVACYKTETDT